MLTLDNSVYGNRCFAQKLCGVDRGPGFRHGKLHQERKIAEEYSQWTPVEIGNRQRRLAAWALKRWEVRRPLPSTEKDSSREVEGSADSDYPVDNGVDLGFQEELAEITASEETGR